VNPGGTLGYFHSAPLHTLGLPPTLPIT
jgi:hypothetical protein